MPDSERYSLLLKNGRVIDPASGIDQMRDVAVTGQTIAAVAADVPADQAQRVVDVSGLIVAPGLIDIHTHVHPFPPQPDSYVESVHADAHLLASGVTTAVDAGTVGWRDLHAFRTRCIERSTTRILAFLNIASGGMIEGATEQDPGQMDPELTAAVARAHADIVVGIKTAHYWTREPWDDAHPPWTSVTRAVEAGDACERPVMVDFWPRPPRRPYDELILSRLRPGDIHTHVFAQQFPILDAEGRVQAYMFAARERGVLFDLGHGAASFWFRNAVPALRDGFAPDTISTDLHMGNINGPVVSLLMTMSKYLNIGMPLPDVIRRTTAAPARVIGHPELGTLSIGAEADIAVLRLLEGSYDYADCGGGRLAGRAKLECALTVRAGQIVYNPTGIGLPLWEQAPEPYWRTPALQP
ncbi:MAG: amidohydrolase/deacetylase family metallohydrolase [Anaerolineae bacterium]|nr:amidohydrolase/deacetylase family metallohydrolase [Anaerolineae bacterium]